MKDELKRMAGLEEDEFTAILVLFFILGAIFLLFIRGCGPAATTLPAGLLGGEPAQAELSTPTLPVIIRGEPGVTVGQYRFEGTGQPGTRLVMLADDTRLGTARVEQNGTWVFETDKLESGLQTVIAHPQTDKTARSNRYPVNIFYQAEKPAPRLLPSFAFGNRGNDRPQTVAEAAIVSDPKTEIMNQRPAGGDNEQADGSNLSAADAPTAVPEPLPTVMLLATVEPEPEPTLVAPTMPAVSVEIAEIVTFGPVSKMVAIRGIATPNSEITLYLNDNAVESLQTDDKGNWSFSGHFPGGALALRATAILDGVSAESAVMPFNLGEGATAEGDAGLRVVYPSDIGLTPTEIGQTGGNGLTVLTRPVVELILDASWSMTFPLESSAEEDRLSADDPNSRIAIAKAALLDLIKEGGLDKTPVALRSFGNVRGYLSCDDNHLMYPLQPVNVAELTGIIGGITPQYNANTAIAASLALVGADLAEAEGDKVIVLLTDGAETCGGDPAAEIEALSAAGIDVQVNIVGFAISDEELKSRFEEWAVLGNGTYYDAADGEGLVDALSLATAAVYTVFDAEGNLVGAAPIGDDLTDIEPGLYRIEIPTTAGMVFENVVVTEDNTTEIIAVSQ